MIDKRTMMKQSEIDYTIKITPDPQFYNDLKQIANDNPTIEMGYRKGEIFFKISRKKVVYEGIR